jgi:hypothetical protein
MKTLLTFLSIGFSISIFAQSHVLVKHNGEKLNVNYIKTNNSVIYFNSGKDQVEQAISTFAVAELIHNATNQSTKVSDKIVVSGKQDYKKVIVIDPNATFGLTKVNSTIVSNIIKGLSPMIVMQQNKVASKRKAAIEGFPFVSVVGENTATSNVSMYTY